jgi:DNA-binding NarL/FixJ family response regulator
VTVDIAIVEDDASIRELLAEWINHAPGFRCVSQHGTTASALARLPAEKPAIVLVDIHLPDLSGIECVRRLKPLIPETQFMMLTVYEDSDHIFKALEAGAVGYLLKPTPCAKLIAALQQICQGGAPMTGYIARKVVQSFQEPPKDTTITETLSRRERDVLDLLTRGYFYKEIADMLDVKQSTVNTFVMRIYEKLHVHSRSQAVAMLKRLGDTATLPKAPRSK